MADKKVRRKPTQKKQQQLLVVTDEMTPPQPINDEIVFYPIEPVGEVNVINDTSNDPERAGFLILEGLPANYPTKLSDVHTNLLSNFIKVVITIAILVVCISLVVKIFG